MGMDGLSMANTGTLKESTSADYTNRSEQAIQSDPSNNSKLVQNLATNQAIREKEEEEENQRNPKQQNRDDNEEFQDGLVEESPVEEFNEDFNIEDLDNPNKDFYVKLNAKDDIIELYESSSDKLIETISGNELQEMVKRLNTVSGIFVNKKV